MLKLVQHKENNCPGIQHRSWSGRPGAVRRKKTAREALPRAGRSAAGRSANGVQELSTALTLRAGLFYHNQILDNYFTKIQ